MENLSTLTPGDTARAGRSLAYTATVILLSLGAFFMLPGCVADGGSYGSGYYASYGYRPEYYGGLGYSNSYYRGGYLIRGVSHGHHYGRHHYYGHHHHGHHHHGRRGGRHGH